MSFGELPRALRKLLPNADFTRAMEELVEKENPDNVIAWPAVPVPQWAEAYRPRTFLDLGCGLGGETVAILSRLAQWGCLERLERVVLVDHDADLSPGGAEGLKLYLSERIGALLAAVSHSGVRLDVFIEELELATHSDGTYDVAPLERLCPQADFIFASHITYFFGDGSGREFVDGLVRHRLSPRGLLWVNIRDQNCPVYLARREALAIVGQPDPQPFDFSEYFAACVLPSLPEAEELARAGVAPSLRRGVDRSLAAELMIWRTRLGRDQDNPAALAAAVQWAADGEGPIHSETAFVLQRHNRRP